MGVWVETQRLETVLHHSRWVVRGKLIGFLEESFPRDATGGGAKAERAAGTYNAEIRVVKVLEVLKGELSDELQEALEIYPSNVRAKTKLAQLYARRIRPSYCAYIYQKADPLDVDDYGEAIYMISYDTNLHIHHLVVTGSLENVNQTARIKEILSLLSQGIPPESINVPPYIPQVINEI